MFFYRLIPFLVWICYVFTQEDDNSDCICVPFYLCDNGTINTNGLGIIDIRIKDKDCADYLETCCEKKDVIPAPVTRAPTLAKKVECGYRNPDGVGFRISGDNDNEAQFGEFPWMIAVFRKGRNDPKHLYKCGGSLIHPRVVLTAAHCISGRDNKFKIRAGEWDSKTQKEMFKHEDREVSSIALHPQYDQRNLHNDVGLLFLNEPVTVGNHINVACLPPQDTIASGTGCFVTGWGKDHFEKDGKYQVILKKIELPVMNRGLCQNAFRGTRLGKFFILHRSFMCAGGEAGKDACTGDGGGPLVCPIDGEEDRFQQVGIVAWGIGCGKEGVPGAYVDVAHFRNWIDKELKKKNLINDTP
ncbi:Trypsin domain containing protein [Asbolus verrucosus]|uniref:Phenoloxidase-activating factor 2 n=1 Tax=Asbolus verrucosus TaxID=1661398 RepID=A0A482W4T9_ASBVE|nr:Trypsin domain containing protein [Asbolus verrucosus]